MSQDEICWKGNSMEEIYRNLNEWELDHLPPIARSDSQTVLFELPIDLSSSAPPKPLHGRPKWDANHVRLPCAPQMDYSIESDVINSTVTSFNEIRFSFPFICRKRGESKKSVGKSYEML